MTSRLLVSLFALAVAGCAAAVRPPAPTYAAAAGAPSCALVAERSEPFVVDWRVDKRGDLEAALGKGTVVVAYDCDKLRILSDCSAEGSYAFAGVTEKEQLIRLVDADEIRANLPLSGGALSGTLKGSLERGATLDVALALVGTKTSSRLDVAPSDLKGDCAGATHFVRSATLGAFVMRTGTRAKTAAAADLLAGAASASSGSEELVENRDGSVEACRAADPTKDTPPARCASPLRLRLRPIKAGAATVAEEPPQCPPGLVRFDDGKCGKRSADAPFICDPSNAIECEQQCTRGSLVSCVYLGKSVRETAPDRAVKLYERACDGGVAEGCGRLGAMKSDLGLLERSCRDGWFPACTAVGATKFKAGDKVDVVAAFKRGCDGGSADDCESYGALFVMKFLPPNDAEQLRAFQRACEGGSKVGCANLAQMYAQGRGTSTDVARAVTLLRSSCDRGASASCAALSSHYLAGNGVERDPAKALALMERACEGDDRGSCLVLGMMYQNGTGRPADEAKARAAFVRACEGGVEEACAAAKR
ncbi:MAG: sel1 repeat family protein [Labilithrix sp.]|nr:sel1 repeat family protein [Labilithrix sp.]MCW5814389.1 sel1 repeat family protein [Labilithrix sp.]